MRNRQSVDILTSEAFFSKNLINKACPFPSKLMDGKFLNNFIMQANHVHPYWAFNCGGEVHDFCLKLQGFAHEQSKRWFLLLSHGMMLQMCFVMLHTLGSITFLM
jgi:hypothetical protein